MPEDGEEGYLLIGAVVAVFIVMLVLGVAAASTARALKREKEIEAQHRGNEYVRAIRVFYRKNGNRYPGSVEQLENTNNQKFLRQRYLDPLTGKDDWRLIHLGENQTTVKGFFGDEFAGFGLRAGLGGEFGESDRRDDCDRGNGVFVRQHAVSGRARAVWVGRVRGRRE